MAKMKRIEVQAREMQGLSERRIDGVLRDSVQTIVSLMQTHRRRGGNMPVDTGFLKNSIMVILDGGPPISTPGTDAEGGNENSWLLAIPQMRAGGVITIGYTAHYAVYQEYGTRFMQGNFFVANAVNRWPSAVHTAVARAKREIKR